MKQGFFRIGRRRERDRESWGILPDGARFTFFSCFHFEDALSYHPRRGLRMTSFQSAFLARSFNFDTRGNITYVADTWWRLKSMSAKEKGGKFLHLCLCVLVPLSFFFSFSFHNIVYLALFAEATFPLVSQTSQGSRRGGNHGYEGETRKRMS